MRHATLGNRERERNGRCDLCGRVFEPESCATGYARIRTDDGEPRRACYLCCADIDIKQMDETGKITLYLSNKDGLTPATYNEANRWYVGDWEVRNWPGTLKFAVVRRTIGGHNFTGRRVDIWFRDMNHDTWHGVQYGHDTQLVHCKRTNGMR